MSIPCTSLYRVLRGLDAPRVRRLEASSRGGGCPRMRPEAAAPPPGPIRPRPHSLGRQSQGEAGAEHRRLAVGIGRAHAVLEPDPAAMGLDDLLGDREAEPGILAAVLM